MINWLFRRRKRKPNPIRFDETHELLNRIIEFLNKPDYAFNRKDKIKRIFRKK